MPGTGQRGGAQRARTLAEVTRTFPRSAAGIVGLARCRLATILPLVAVHTHHDTVDKPKRLSWLFRTVESPAMHSGSSNAG